MIVDRVAERFRNARYRQIPQTHRPTYASYSAIDRTTEGIQARARAREEQDRWTNIDIDNVTTTIDSSGAISIDGGGNVTTSHPKPVSEALSFTFSFCSV